MSSATFSNPRHGLVRAVARDAAGRVTGSASAAAEDALSQFQPDEFRRAARVRRSSRKRARKGLAGIIDEAVAVAGLIPWRRLILAIVGLGLVTVCVVPAVVFLTRPKPPCELYPVRGSLVFGKTVPVGARIVLTPQEGGWPYDSFPTATVGKDGSFRVSTFGKEDGAPAGTYVATVQWFPIASDGTVGRNALPKRYASPNTSPLTVSVSLESTSLPPLRISR
ncbi:MAG: hypothetical protein ACKOYJ_09035 [Planctomycetia bacterium]